MYAKSNFAKPLVLFVSETGLKDEMRTAVPVNV